MNTHVVSPAAWQRMVSAVEKVRDRLRRAAQALESAGIPYAVAGGNAVAAWVSEVDEAAARNTQDVDLLMRRADLERAKSALATAGFVYRHSSGIDMFLDGPGAKARDAVHIVFANERVRAEYSQAAPDVDEAKPTATFRVLDLPALLRMKLTSFRRKDQVHVLDLIGVGLVDESWVSRLPSELAPRLQELLDHPDD
ncbi:MAG: nucleotidyltransferase family protein [Pirellulales bacterium]